jgi:hypothetical protein
MPHTARKYNNKNINNKRVEITDDSGWTHVTSTLTQRGGGGRRRKVSNATRQRPDENDHNHENENEPLQPASAPPRLTLPELQKQFHSHSEQWKNSQTWEYLQKALLQSQSSSARTAIEKTVTNVVCIGLGSPSGFVRGGWVDRRSVALYQLGALVSVLEVLG